MSAAPFLLVDAGNSRVKWALARADGSPIETGAFAHGTDAAMAAANDPHWTHLPTPGSVWISNVAGVTVASRIDALLDGHWRGVSRTTIRSLPEQCGVTNGYTTPSALGTDRWAGMIGARAAFPGEPLLIATFGTATTLEALRADGVFIGGLIAPGWSLMMRSLGEHTAQLPTLDAAAASTLLTDGVHDDATPQDRIEQANRRGLFFATDTQRSLSAGCALAQVALIERMWRDLQDAWRMPVRLVVSGGAAEAMTASLKVPHTRHDSLVLSGLARIAAASAPAGHA